jgi:hypothetical protein
MERYNNNNTEKKMNEVTLTDSAILDKMRYSGPYGATPYGTGSSYATLSSVQHGLDCNSKIYGHGQDAIFNELENLDRANSFQNVQKSFSDMANINGQNQLRISRENADARSETAQGFSSVLLELCKCCKDSEIRTLEENCKTRELVRDENGKTRELLQANQITLYRDQNNINATVQPIVAAIGDLKTVLAHH